MSIEIREIYSRLQKFVVAATRLSDERVVFANQIAAVRPKKPFVAISLGSFRNVGSPIEKKVSSKGEIKVTMSMVCVASFKACSDILHESESILDEVFIKTRTDLQNEILGNNIAVQKTIKPTSALPIMLNEQNESQAILELQLGFNKTTSYEVGLIESVEMDAVINKKEIHLNTKR